MPVTRRSTRSQSLASTASSAVSASDIDDAKTDETSRKVPASAKKGKNAAGNARIGRKTAGKQAQDASKMTVNRAIKGRRASAKTVAQFEPSSSADEQEEDENVASQSQDESESVANSEETHEEDEEEDLTFALPPPLTGSAGIQIAPEEQDEEQEEEEEEDEEDDDDDGASTPRQNGVVTLEELASFAQAGLTRLLDKHDYVLTEDEGHMLSEYSQRVKTYLAVYPMQSSQDSQVERMLFPRTVLPPRGASHQIVAWTRLVNLLIFHGALLLTLIDVDGQMLCSLLLMESALLSDFVPRSIRTSPDILKLYLEMKCQIILNHRKLKEIQEHELPKLGKEEERISIGHEANYFAINEDELERLFGNHQDARIAIERLQKDCKAAWKKLKETPLNDLLEDHPYESFMVQAVEVIDRCVRISKTEAKAESPEPARKAPVEHSSALKARKTLVPPARQEPIMASPVAGPSRQSPSVRALNAVLPARSSRTARKVSSEVPAVLLRNLPNHSTPSGRGDPQEPESSQSDEEDEVERSFRLRTVRRRAESERRISEPRRKAQASVSSPIKKQLGDRILQVLSPIRREKRANAEGRSDGSNNSGSKDADNSSTTSRENQVEKNYSRDMDAIAALKGTPVGEQEDLDLGSDIEKALNGETSQESDAEEEHTVIASAAVNNDVFVDIDTIMQSEDEDAAAEQQSQDIEDEQSESQYKQTYDPEDVEAALLGSPSQRPLDGPHRSQLSSSASKATDQGRKTIQPPSDSEEEDDDDEEEGSSSDASDGQPRRANGVYRGLAISKDNRIVQRQEHEPRVIRSMLDRQPDAERISMSSPSTQTQTERNSPATRQGAAEQRRSMSIPVVEEPIKSSKAKGKQRQRSVTAEAPSVAQPLFYPEPEDNNPGYHPNDFDFGAGDDYPPDEEQNEREEQNDVALTNMEDYLRESEPVEQDLNSSSPVIRSAVKKKPSKSHPWPSNGADVRNANSAQEDETRSPPRASSSGSKQKQRQKEKSKGFQSSSEEDELAEHAANLLSGRAGSDVDSEDEIRHQTKAFEAWLRASRAASKEGNRSASKDQSMRRTKGKERAVEIRPENRDPERIVQKDRHKGDSARRQDQARRQSAIRRPPLPDSDSDDDDEELPPVAGPSSRPYVASKKRKRPATQISDDEEEAPVEKNRRQSKGKTKGKGRRGSDEESSESSEEDVVPSDSDSDDERLYDRIWKKYSRELLEHRPDEIKSASEGENKKRKPRQKIVAPPRKEGLYARKAEDGSVIKPKQKYLYSSSKKHGRMGWTKEEDLMLLYGLKKLSDPQGKGRWKSILDKYGASGTKHLKHRTGINCKDRARTIQKKREDMGLPRLPWYSGGAP